MSDSPAMTAAPSAPAPSAPSAPSPSPSSTPSSSTSSPSTGSTGTSPSTAPSGGGGDPGAKSLGLNPTDAKASPTTEAKIKEEIRKHKLKVNGREVEFDEPEVLRKAQLAEAADQKFKEASEMRKQTAELLDILKKNPVAVMTKLGMNPREFAESFLAGELQKEMLSPEQRELLELREYRSAQEKARQETETTQQERVRQQEVAKMQQKAAADYDVKITEALNTSNLPKTPETIKRVAGLLMSALQKGYELDPQTAVDMVRQQYVTDVQSMFGGMKGEALVKMLGDGLVKEMRQYDLARIKQKLEPQQPAVTSAPQSATPRQAAPEKSSYLSQDAWLEAIRKKAGV